MSLSLTFTHPNGNLIIPGRPSPGVGHGAWITDLTMPSRVWKRSYSDSSAFTPGSGLLAAVLGETFINAVVSIKAPNSDELDEQIAWIETVTAQFAYVATTETATRTQAWRAMPADINYGNYSVGQDRMSAMQIGLSIPVNPPT